MLKLLILTCLCVYATKGIGNEVLFAAFAGLYPNDYKDLGSLSIGQQIKMTIKCAEPSPTIYFKLQSGPDIPTLTERGRSSKPDPYTSLLEMNIPETQHYWMDIYSNAIDQIDCWITVLVDGFLLRNEPSAINHGGFFQTHKITTGSKCRLKMNYGDCL